MGGFWSVLALLGKRAPEQGRLTDPTVHKKEQRVGRGKTFEGGWLGGRGVTEISWAGTLALWLEAVGLQLGAGETRTLGQERNPLQHFTAGEA